MEFILEETEVRVKEDSADTNNQGQGQVDLTPEWKLHPNVECRVTLERVQNFPSEILSSMESHVSWSTLSSPQTVDRQAETNARSEHADKLIRDPLRTLIPSIDDQIDIKYEGNGILNHSRSTLNDLDIDPDPYPNLIFSNMNPKAGTHRMVNSEQIDLSEFYLRLPQCERDCEICQKYIKGLSEHIRAAHAADQPTRDPLHVDPLEVGQSSAIGIKCEASEDIENQDSSIELESDPDYNIESGNDSDPDCTTSPALTRKECGKEGPRKETSTARKRSHTRKKQSKIQFKCRDCSKGYTTKRSLIIHMRTHSGEEPFKCRECEKSFTRKGTLDDHLRTHTGEKPFKCGLCLKSFRRNTHLTIHMRCHTGYKPFKCTVCEKSFTQKGSLDYHLRSHTGEKPFQCAECVSSFKTKHELTHHVRVHTGEKPFKCTECEKSFSHKWNFDNHMRSHTGEKLFKCDFCLKGFSRKSCLDIHIKTHTGENSFV